MKIKSLISLIIIFALAFSLAACGAKEEVPAGPRPDPTVEFDCGGLEDMFGLLGKTPKKAGITDDSIKYTNDAPTSALVKGSFMDIQGSGTLYFTGKSAKESGVVDYIFFMFEGVGYDEAMEYLKGQYGEPVSVKDEAFTTDDGAIRSAKFDSGNGFVKLLSGSLWDFVDLTVSRS